MAWIESHQEVGRHPKTKKFARLLGVSLPAAVGHLHLLWWWALDFAQDGDLSKYDGGDIADAMLWDGDDQDLMNALIDAGYIDATDNGPVLHDWEEYAGKLLDRRAKDRARKKPATEKRTTPEDVQQASGGNPAEIQRNSDGNPTELQRNSDGSPTEVARIPSVPYLTVPNQTEPNQTNKTEGVPFEKIRLLWNDVCVSFAKIQGINGKRQKTVAARWHERPELSWWAEYFARIEASDFLKGKNDRGWHATFDWVVNPANMDKILEGNYDPKKGVTPHGTDPRPPGGTDYCKGFQPAED